jgi:hypothetical protein
MTAILYRRNQVFNMSSDIQMTPNGLSLVYDAEQIVEFGTNIDARVNSEINFPLRDLFFGLSVIPNAIQALIAVNARVIFPLEVLYNIIMDAI